MEKKSCKSKWILRALVVWWLLYEPASFHWTSTRLGLLALVPIQNEHNPMTSGHVVRTETKHKSHGTACLYNAKGRKESGRRGRIYDWWADKCRREERRGEEIQRGWDRHRPKERMSIPPEASARLYQDDPQKFNGDHGTTSLLSSKTRKNMELYGTMYTTRL